MTFLLIIATTILRLQYTTDLQIIDSVLIKKATVQFEYKISIINNIEPTQYQQHGRTWDTEIKRIKQTLVNNNYPNRIIDYEINRFLNKKFSNITENQNNKTTLKIFYNNQMHNNYKQDERIIKSLVTDNIVCNPDYSIQIIFYSKNLKSSNLVIKKRTDFNFKRSRKT